MTKTHSVAAWLTVLAVAACFNPAWGAQHKPVAGGANQRTSVEGCMGQTLFDGFWRFKVTSVTTADEPGDLKIPAYAVALDIRNARAVDSSPSMLGVGLPQLVLDDGTVLELSTGSHIAYSNQLQFKSLAPGAGAHVVSYFRVENTTAKPSKLLLGITRANPATKASYGYPTADPSFRVHLDCTK